MMAPNNYDELVKYCSAPVAFQGKCPPRMQYLIDCKYIEPSKRKCIEDSPDDIQIVTIEWAITPKGEDALVEFEQARSKDAEEKRQKRHDRAFDIFLVVFAYALGLVTPYFISLFH